MRMTSLPASRRLVSAVGADPAAANEDLRCDRCNKGAEHGQQRLPPIAYLCADCGALVLHQTSERLRPVHVATIIG